MKSQKDFRSNESVLDPDDVLRKPAKLEPARKSGKERHSRYEEFDEDDEFDEELDYHAKRESVLDYFDDGEDEGDEE